MPLTLGLVAAGEKFFGMVRMEKTMRRWTYAVAAALLALSAVAATPVFAAPQDNAGKNCRMEQQCHWENFKKICVYVKVCR